MPIVCRNRPNRSDPRYADVKAAARFMCAAINRGATQREIELEAAEQGCWVPNTDEECQKKKRAALALAEGATLGNQQTLAIADEALNAMGQLFRLLLFVLRRSGVGAVASVPISTITTSLATTRKIVGARKAANDEVFQQIAKLAA